MTISGLDECPCFPRMTLFSTPSGQMNGLICQFHNSNGISLEGGTTVIFGTIVANSKKVKTVEHNMQIKNEIMRNGKQLAIGAFGLACVELKEIAAEVVKNAIVKLVFLLCALMVAAWTTVAVANWLSVKWGWQYASTGMALFTFVVAYALFYFPQKKIAKKAWNSDEIESAASTSASVETYQGMIRDAKDNFIEVTHEIKDAAKEAINPALVMEKTICKNPIPFLAGSALLGMYLGTRKRG